MKIPLKNGDSVSAILERPRGAKALLVLAHGAGAGMEHPTMERLAETLHAHGVATLRFQFLYMERGTRRPDPPTLATATVAAAVEAAAKKAGRLPLFAGGKSFGGRMTTTAASMGLLPGIRGIVCFGFPLHPPKKPSVTRAAHLVDLPVPALFVQGTRDDLAELKLMRATVRKYREKVALHLVQGADHGFACLKSSGRGPAEVYEAIGAACRDFIERHRGI